MFFKFGFENCIVVGRCGSFWVRCGSLWIVVDRCGSLWMVVGRFGWFLVLVTTVMFGREAISPLDAV